MGIADVVAVGAVASLGANPLQLALCVRAGMFQPRSLQLRDRRGRRIGMCLAGGVDEGVTGNARLLALGTDALKQAIAGLSLDGWPMLLALPDDERPDANAELNTQLLPQLATAANLTVDDQTSRTFSSGAPGGAQTLAEALRLIEEGADGAIVGGIDSYLGATVLRWLEQEHRLHTLTSHDGFVPGEGAAFAIVARPGAVPRAAIGRLVHAAVDHEAGAHDAEPNTAAAMTRLLRAGGGHKAATWVLNDVNGERHRVREWSLVQVRHRLASTMELRLPSHCGDVGAASAPLMVALACAQWRLGCAPADSALLMVHTEGSARGVVQLAEAQA